MTFDDDFFMGIIPILFLGVALMSFLTIVDAVISPVQNHCMSCPLNKNQTCNKRDYFFLKGLLAITLLTLALILNHISTLNG